MNPIPHKTERIHSLDSLRAIMMLLGLVLHSALTFGVYNYGEAWPLKDPNATHPLNDLLVGVIHLFRIPIFFVVAGFFGAMLFYERGPLKMFKNRVSRIAYPFIVFLPILTPIILFSFIFSGSIFNGDEAALETLQYYFSNPINFIPQRTYHLWFLYYLFLITLLTLCLGLLFKKVPNLTSNMTKAFDWIIKKPVLRILFFAFLTFILYEFMNTKEVETSVSLIPDLNTFLFYFQFYIFGWVLFKSKHLLDKMMRFDWLYTILGLTTTLIYLLMFEALTFEIFILIKSISVWLLIFGITGLYIRYGSSHSHRMRYVSDATYWVYLIHLPLTIIIPSLIIDWPLPATVKFLIVLISTTTICFITYNYLVRATFIGKFLNGRKYSRKISDIKQVEELSRIETVIDK